MLSTLPNTQKNCLIFDSCNALFPQLELGLKLVASTKEVLELVANSEYESDLKILHIPNKPLKGQFRVRLFIEFELGGIIRKHPEFLIQLDYNTKRAKVLSFESNLYPPIKLDAYTEIDDQRYINIVASKDLTTLCTNWIKQLKQLSYQQKWLKKLKLA